MQLTIDTDQKLEDVLRVVGALYNVQLTTADVAVATPRTAARDESSSATTRHASSRSSRSSRSSGRRAGRNVRTGRGGRAQRAGASPAEVRAWAQAHGHDVSGRGRIPAGVVAAFQADH